ncbi:uncharacterized protein BKA55DRAFT_467502, partial [Fusarium redolens]
MSPPAPFPNSPSNPRKPLESQTNAGPSRFAYQDQHRIKGLSSSVIRATSHHFPAVPPVVAFTGPVVGSGRTLLRKESIPGLDGVQLKCCGFVQLSTFIAPGNPDKTPFKGFHPFQVFVIFPIHANPWAALCKKMVERQDTQFQTNALFTCTGKVAGMLDYIIMVHPPGFDRDYVFIVVPDTWTFLDRATPKSAAAALSLSTPPK